jgi:hypothetical protein
MTTEPSMLLKIEDHRVIVNEATTNLSQCVFMCEMASMVLGAGVAAAALHTGLSTKETRDYSPLAGAAASAAAMQLCHNHCLSGAKEKNNQPITAETDHVTELHPLPGQSYQSSGTYTFEHSSEWGQGPAHELQGASIQID